MHEMKLLGLDLDLLVALDCLLETGSVSAAATRLHRSQPAVSRMLSRLRDVFDDPLFVPHGRGLVPTTRVLALQGPLKIALSEIRRLVSPPQSFNPTRDAAHFRMISSDYAAVALLGQVVRWLHAQAPKVRLDLISPMGNPEQLLAKGEADLLFGPPALCPAWCASQPFIRDTWVCVRRHGEPLPQTRKEYFALAHIAVQIEMAFGDPIGGALKKRDASARRIQVTVPDFAAAVFVAATTPLLATLPKPVAMEAAKIVPLAIGAVPLPIPDSIISMIWPRRLDSDPAHLWLRDAVTQSFKHPLGSPAN